MGFEEMRAGIIRGVKSIVSSAKWVENTTRKNSYHCSKCKCCTTQKLEKCPNCNSIMKG